MLVSEKLITADEFLQMEFEDGKRYELVNGRLEEMPMSGGEASQIGMWFGSLIVQHVRKHDLGHVTGADGGYILTTNPDTTRYPDVGFISKVRLPKMTAKFIPFAPDLAVEVISPSDHLKDVQKKAKEYLSYGTKVVWVLDPEEQTVAIHTLIDAETVAIRTLNINGVLDGGEVLPGFSIDVKEIFK
jgi:Uma2 family endonuclease